MAQAADKGWSRKARQGPKSLPGSLLYEAGDRARTGDPQLGKLMLYQLSYARMF